MDVNMTVNISEWNMKTDEAILYYWIDGEGCVVYRPRSGSYSYSPQLVRLSSEETSHAVLKIAKLLCLSRDDYIEPSTNINWDIDWGWGWGQIQSYTGFNIRNIVVKLYTQSWRIIDGGFRCWSLKRLVRDSLDFTWELDSTMAMMTKPAEEPTTSKSIIGFPTLSLSKSLFILFISCFCCWAEK